MNISAPLFGQRDRSSCYVRFMTAHQQLDETLEGLVVFGTPVVASNSTLRASTAIAAGERQNFSSQIVVDSAFGRTINVTTTAAGVVTVFGRDYLNQQISEAVTLGSGTTVATAKCFKYIDAIHCTTAISVGLGPGTALALPFVTAAALQEFAAGAAATLGTFTAPDVTTPATTTTDDPRGRYVPSTTLNGSTKVELKCRFRNDTVDGLYGVPQV